MKKRAGILAGALLMMGALVLLGWLFQPPDTSVPTAELTLPDIDRAPPMPEQADAAEVQRPVEAGWRDIACPLPVEPSSYGWTQVLVEPPGKDPTWSAGTLNTTTLKFMGPAADGVGLVTLPGYERAGLLWYTDSNGDIDCYFPTQPERLAHGVLRLPGPELLGEDMHLVVAGMGWSMPTTDDGWVEKEFPAGPVEVRVCTSSAMYSRSCTDVQTVTVVADKTTVFEPEVLAPPDLTVEYEPHPDGFVLRYGNEEHSREMLILSVDGVPTAGMDQQTVEALVDADGEVKIEVAGPDDRILTHWFEWPR